MKDKLLNIIGIAAVVVMAIVAVFMTKEKIMQVGIKPENMDFTIKPGNDFYDFATLGWRKSNPIPDDYTKYGSFDILRNTNLERVREIAETDDGKIGLLYKIAMNKEKLNTDKTQPVQSYFSEIDNIKSIEQLPEYLGKIHKFSTSFWDDGVLPDEKDSEHYLLNIGQGGTCLTRDYYFDNDEKTKEIRKKYKQYIKTQMDNFGITVDADKLYALEERMAKSFYKKELLRDPFANYHKKSIAELKNELSGFDWDTYFKSRGIKPEYVNVAQIEPIKESIAIMHDTDLNLIKAYLKLTIINFAESLLDDKTYDIAFDFYTRTLSGQKEQKPRWKRAVARLDDSLGEEIGRLYVKKYFPESAKKRMQDLVKNLQRAYEIRIQNLNWMTETTKKRALDKLHTFKAKIGYPDKWRDYSELEIKDDSLFANMVRVAVFEDAFWLNKVGKKIDSTIWYMNAHEVNAYYDPMSNEVCFPAGILQYPFFDMDSDDAFNYGAIGSVIGHEITHGFDDQGRHFDYQGNMKDWWQEIDIKGFEKRAGVMRDFFNNIIVAPNTHANGEFTLGENLADYGGLVIAFAAYKKFGKKSETAMNLTPEQRFFVAYAMCETANIRDEEVLNRTKIDVHSLPRWRINGILPHVDAWYDAFNISDQDKMYVAPEKRVNLW